MLNFSMNAHMNMVCILAKSYRYSSFNILAIDVCHVSCLNHVILTIQLKKCKVLIQKIKGLAFFIFLQLTLFTFFFLFETCYLTIQKKNESIFFCINVQMILVGILDKQIGVGFIIFLQLTHFMFLFGTYYLDHTTKQKWWSQGMFFFSFCINTNIKWRVIMLKIKGLDFLIFL